MMKILTISSANIDFVMDIEKIPDSGQTLLDYGSYKYVPGGKGANSAVAFSRLGADSVFCTSVGCDANAQTLRSLYVKEGLNTEYIEESKTHPTGLAAIFVEKSGANRIIVFPGANMQITQDNIINSFKTKPDALFLQLEISHQAILLAAQTAKELSIPIIMDAGPADITFLFDKLPLLKIFSPNETEANAFTGISPDNEENCLLCVNALDEMVRSEFYVIKLGARGCYVYDSTKKEGCIIPSLKVLAIDTTAAGDAFTAALALEYLRCADIIRAAKYANVVGAITVGRKGASSSIPNSAEVETFILKNNLLI